MNNKHTFRTNKMSTNVVTTPCIAKTESVNQIYSTVCDVCEGIGEEDHPRSTILDTSVSGWFFYIYLHYPDPRLLRSSYERYACQTCRLILSCIRHQSSGRMDPDDEQERDEMDILAHFDISQDTDKAASLVGSAEIDKNCIHEWPLRSALQIEGCGSGRLALRITCHSRQGPRINAGRVHLDVVFHIFESDSQAPPLPRPMKLFCSPG